MIDIENIVINTIYAALTDAGISAEVSSVYKDTPETFPHVYARQIDNATLRSTQDTSLLEHHASVRFRVDVFSNKSVGAKEEVKTIANVVDLAMQTMKFTRAAFNFIPNYDRTVVRAYADYTAIVGEGRDVNGVTVHQMYRR